MGSKTINIILCNTCKGAGFTTYHETTCYHRNEYDVIKKICSTCKGSGRLLETTIIETDPYIEEE